MYGEHRPYGYVYGGSGGGFKTISCVESTNDVWDGAVPFILGSPMSLPNVFSVQAHAMRILWDRFPQINDALAPGGSGDMYAGLTAEEREALAEVTRMGFPPRAWFNYQRIAHGYTGVWSVLGDNMLKYDPQYFEDFWTVPGYLGANPSDSLVQARVQHKTTVVRPILIGEAQELGLPLAMAIAAHRVDGRRPRGPPGGGGAGGHVAGLDAQPHQRCGGRRELLGDRRGRRHRHRGRGGGLLRGRPRHRAR